MSSSWASRCSSSKSFERRASSKAWQESSERKHKAQRDADACRRLTGNEACGSYCCQHTELKGIWKRDVEPPPHARQLVARSTAACWSWRPLHLLLIRMRSQRQNYSVHVALPCSPFFPGFALCFFRSVSSLAALLAAPARALRLAPAPSAGSLAARPHRTTCTPVRTCTGMPHLPLHLR